MRSRISLGIQMVDRGGKMIKASQIGPLRKRIRVEPMPEERPAPTPKREEPKPSREAPAPKRKEREKVGV